MRSARLQYALLLLVAVCSLTYYVASVSATLDEIYGNRVARNPTYHGYRLRAVSGLQPEATAAGIHWGDRILSLNGRPLTGYNSLLEELRKSHAGDVMQVTFLPATAPSAPRTASVVLAPVYAQRPGVLKLVVQMFFLSILFPLGCLLLGLWVVAAKPRDKNAWFLLGILQYFVIIFAGEQFWPGFLFAFTTMWSSVLLVAGPLCIMLFGIYFPERSSLDLRFPWIKWSLIAVLAVLLPVILIYNYGFAFSFDLIASWSPWIGSVFRAMTIVAMAAISIYFFSLGRKTGTSTSPDVRRRLSILLAGSTIANLPLFAIVLISVVRGTDLGADIPPYIMLAAFCVFALFPVSLAYVVVAYRAMDLRIILRQGTKYALARTTLWILRAGLGIILAIAIKQAYAQHWRLANQIVVVVLVALLLAFRFRLRESLSLWIDRRFFREAYSSEQVLNELASQAQNFTETQPLIRTVSECISNALHVDRIAVLIRSGNTFRLEHAIGVGAGGELLLPDTSKTITNLNLARTPANVYLDNPDNWLVAATEDERSALRELGAEMLLPLPGRNRMIGVIALGAKRSEEPYSKTDRSLLQSVALHTGLSIENSELVRSLASEAAKRERLNREIEVAREVQERFLPQTYPEICGVDLAGGYRAAQGVGGDYYDFIELASGNGYSDLGVAIGDVSGKGVSAALLMASLRASLRGMLRAKAGDLAAMMSDVNELVFEASADNRYATFFFAYFDPSSRKLTYVNAGHNPPAVLRAANGRLEVIRLEAGGPVIGLMARADYEQTTLLMQPGDILLAFTDGISEAMNPEDEEWGEDRLIDTLTQCTALPADVIVNCLIETADKFANGAPQHDDMTLLVLKFGGGAEQLSVALS